MHQGGCRDTLSGSTVIDYKANITTDICCGCCTAAVGATSVEYGVQASPPCNNLQQVTQSHKNVRKHCNMLCHSAKCRGFTITALILCIRVVYICIYACTFYWAVFLQGIFSPCAQIFPTFTQIPFKNVLCSLKPNVCGIRPLPACTDLSLRHRCLYAYIDRCLHA